MNERTFKLAMVGLWLVTAIALLLLHHDGVAGVAVGIAVSVMVFG